MRALTRMRHTMRAQLTYITELQRKLARAKNKLQTIAQQRDEFDKNARAYYQALVDILASLDVMQKGFSQIVGMACRQAENRMRERILTPQTAETPDTDR